MEGEFDERLSQVFYTKKLVVLGQLKLMNTQVFGTIHHHISRQKIKFVRASALYPIA